jgi:drug/metabolite transporter (DMT)-like permease
MRWLLLLMISLVLVSASWKTPRRIPLTISALFLFALLAAGCGSGGYGGGNGGSTGTPAGNYQLLVSASSSGVTKTMTLNLTVQ